MKKSFLFLCLMGSLLMVPAVAGNSVPATTIQQSVKVQSSSNPKDHFAKILFDKLSCDLGKFPASDPVRKCYFTFTNNGTAPLVIHAAMASCGCTVPNYPKTPIQPGEKDTIEVTYNGTGKFPGKFSKTITIRSNAVTEVVRLTVMGEMTE